MTKSEAENLPIGLYRLHWVDEVPGQKSSSLAAVGMLDDGRRWFAAINWTSREPAGLACEEWSKVARAELLERAPAGSARLQMLETIAEGVCDMLDGEPSGSDSLDFALHQYGYRPTKGVAAPSETAESDPVASALRRPVVPDELVDAYTNDPIVWTVFQHGAIQGWDLHETLIQLAKALSTSRADLMREFSNHLLACPVGVRIT